MLFNTFSRWTESVKEKWRLAREFGKMKAEAEDYFSRVERMVKRTPLHECERRRLENYKEIARDIKALEMKMQNIKPRDSVKGNEAHIHLLRDAM